MHLRGGCSTPCLHTHAMTHVTSSTRYREPNAREHCPTLHRCLSLRTLHPKCQHPASTQPVLLSQFSGTCKHLGTLESAGYTQMLQRGGGLPEHAVCSHLMARHPVNEISRGCPRQTHYLLKLVNILRCLVKGIVKHTV